MIRKTHFQFEYSLTIPITYGERNGETRKENISAVNVMMKIKTFKLWESKTDGHEFYTIFIYTINNPKG